MSQFPQPGYYDPNAISTTPRKSGLAITSLVFSLIGIIPCLGLITAPLGILLGVIGVVSISPPKTGKGMAMAAILIGIVLTAGQVFVVKKGYDFFYGFYALAMKGPNDALTLGFSGDVAGFKGSFYGAGASAPDSEAQAFLAELTKRYGTFTSAAMDESGGQPNAQPGQPTIALPYNLRFGGTTVKAESELIFADQASGAMVKKLGYVHVIDPTNGDLVYPSGAVSLPSGSGASDAGNGAGENPPTSAPNG